MEDEEIKIWSCTSSPSGLMTSALSNDENTAIMMALGIFYPLLLLSGIVWPIQGIPVALR